MHILFDWSCCSKSIWVQFWPITIYLCCHSTFYTIGKDKIIFVTKEDHETPSSAELVEEDPNDPYEERGMTSTFCPPVVWLNFPFVRFEKHKFATYILTSPPVFIPGLILPSGEINWNCPCLGGMASGPCGTEFKEAFSCFHYSKEEVKGSDCLEQFRAMQECMQRYPELYPKEDETTPQEQSSERHQTPTDSPSVESSNTNSNSTKPHTEESDKPSSQV